MATNPAPAHLIVFSNGMVAAFDSAGQQIPEYQGRYAESVEKLKGLDLSNCQFEAGIWGAGLKTLTEEEFFSIQLSSPKCSKIE